MIVIVILFTFYVPCDSFAERRSVQYLLFPPPTERPVPSALSLNTRLLSTGEPSNGFSTLIESRTFILSSMVASKTLNMISLTKSIYNSTEFKFVLEDWIEPLMGFRAGVVITNDLVKSLIESDSFLLKG